MFRFTIRDLLWLMVVVGLGAAWFSNNQRLASLTKALADEQAKPLSVVVGGYTDTSTQLKPGESVVVSIAKDGRSASYRPLRVDQEKIPATYKQPQP